MDRPVVRKRGKRYALIAGALLLTAMFGAMLWSMVPRGLQVASDEVRIAMVEKGVFRDDIVVRAIAEPRNSVILDSVESGRVEEVVARDGAMVAKGQLLFRLSNPQRHLELLARQAEHAQQISNLSTLRLAQEASQSEHRRRLSELGFALSQAKNSTPATSSFPARASSPASRWKNRKTG